ncbi:hypothetical protein [Acinetobacter sp.]|uniref:vWA domain-containing protein n=1 Tax=Acinetobacter sp. TaxID=472 RepID=UPI003750C481
MMDRSGSMQSIQNSTISGFNEYLNQAKRDAELPGVKSFTSVLLFDDEFILLNEFSDTKKVKELTTETFVPRGGTALNDAIAKAIAMMRHRLAGREGAADVDVTITVMTDGQENQSKEFPANSYRDPSNYKLTALIKQMRNDYGWAVVFIGAGDPTQVQHMAQSYGVDLSNVKHYNANEHDTLEMMRGVTSARNIKSSNFANYGTKCSANYFSNTLQTEPTVDTTIPTVTTTEDTKEA